jgi:transcriptional regulator with XRE-family HTH domain
MARKGLGLSLASVASQLTISTSELSRIERGLAPWVSAQVLAEACAIVGLDLSMKAYASGTRLRDGRHAALLDRFRRLVHPSLGWATEVPMPIVGDQRAWDAVIGGPGWLYAVEAERNPVDGQALCRRLRLKHRDSGVDGVILLLPDTRGSREF